MENLSEQQHHQPDQIIAYIAFEATTTRTFLTYAVILLFSLGILMVLVTNDEKNDKEKQKEESFLTEKNEEVILNTNEDIVVEQMIEVPLPEEEFTVSSSLDKELKTEFEPEVEPEPVVLIESIEVEVLKEEAPNEETTAKEDVLEPEVESVIVVEPLIEIEAPKTPKRRQTRHHEVTPPSSPPLPMSPRRSERKVKKPVLFDPSRR
jgi:hypothetical protein